MAFILPNANGSRSPSTECDLQGGVRSGRSFQVTIGATAIEILFLFDLFGCQTFFSESEEVRNAFDMIGEKSILLGRKRQWCIRTFACDLHQVEDREVDSVADLEIRSKLRFESVIMRSTVGNETPRGEARSW
jgi:hypothetical protein